MSSGDRLQEQAASRPDGSAEESAERLRPRLERYAEESERKERTDEGSSADAAPDKPAPGVAEHERDMARRGFEPDTRPD